MIGSLDSLQFDLYDKNVFYAIGSTNELYIDQEIDDKEGNSDDYEEMAADVLKQAKGKQKQFTQFRIEKFFINSEENF